MAASSCRSRSSGILRVIRLRDFQRDQIQRRISDRDGADRRRKRFFCSYLLSRRVCKIWPEPAGRAVQHFLQPKKRHFEGIALSDCAHSEAKLVICTSAPSMTSSSILEWIRRPTANGWPWNSLRAASGACFTYRKDLPTDFRLSRMIPRFFTRCPNFTLLSARAESDGTIRYLVSSGQGPRNMSERDRSFADFDKGAAKERGNP